MKKTYMQPSVEVVRLTAENLICDSVKVAGVLGSETNSGNFANDRYDFDDDDDLGSIIPW